MPTPVPVPSKAAIRALRGLVLGTTCTLALVTEDRRRRINTARRAISNGEKLKSCSKYQPGAAVDVISSKQYEGEAFLSEPCPHRSPSELDPPPRPPTVPLQEPATATIRASTWLMPARRPKTAIPERRAITPAKKRRAAPETVCLHGLAADITALVQTRRPQGLVDATALLGQTLGRPVSKSETGREELLRATALLSRACLDAELMDDAMAVLQLVLRLGPIDEGAYFAHDPLRIVEDTLLRERVGMTPSGRYKLAVDLFAPDLKHNPTGLWGDKMLKTAERLIEAGVDTQRTTLVTRILFERVNWYIEEPGMCGFLRRVFERMHRQSMFEPVVRYFVSCSQYHQRMMADRDEYYGVCDLVVKCVSEANGYRAADVMECLRKHQPANVNMRVAWVSELLYLHWKREGKYGETLELFLSLRAANISELVAYPDGVYRAIIQVALEAGETSAAQEHFDELIKHQPSCKDNLRILGLFAQAQARAGDWAAVDELFRRMFPATRAVSRQGTDVLIPILREFRAGHTIQETEAFLRFVLDDLKVPLTKYMVTLIAAGYGAARDVKSFLAWLKYCSGTDLRMDAAFSNAILTSCRNHWRFGFMDLMRVYRTLQGFGPAFTDSVTENLVTGAALTSPASYRKVSLALALRSRQRRRRDLLRSRYDPTSVSTLMATWIEVGRPDKAVRSYKFVTASGMPHCPQCLRLFAVAAMKLGTDNLNEVLHTLQGVKKTGVDTSEAITALFTADLESVDRTLGGRHIEDHARKVLRGLERYGLKTSSQVLNKAATAFLKTKNHDAALGLALMAAEVRGEAPGYNMANFKIMFDIYSNTRQWERLSKLFEVVTRFGWWSRMAARPSNLLKRVKYLWRREKERRGGCGGPELESLETVIRNITLQRDSLKRVQLEVQEGVLGILASAAEDSGCDVREPGVQQNREAEAEPLQAAIMGFG